MIASLSLSVPVIVIGWSHKYLEVMKQFGLESFVFDYSDTNIELQKYVDEILNDEKSFKKEIESNIPIVKKESFKQFEYLFDEILD